jgi:lambda family phage portal protein
MARAPRQWMSGTAPQASPPAWAQEGSNAWRAFGVVGGSRMVPGLEAGSLHRRLTSWNPTPEHVNVLLRTAGNTTLNRARWLVRNNGYAKSALRSWRSATVGPGIKPSSLIDDQGLRETVNKLWLDWTDEADAEGVTDLYGIQRRVAGEAFLAGECFVRMRPRLPVDNLRVPMQLQVMPAEQLPLGRDDVAPTGNPVRLGIEFDRNLRDKRVAYWFYRHDPSDMTIPWRDAFEQNLLTRVPAEDVLHVFDPVESGQIRGLTSFGAAMVKMFHLDLYDDAELERKKQQARFAAVLTSSDTQSEVEMTDLAELPIGPFGPGAYAQLNPGEDIKFTEPGEVGGSYEPFQYRTLLAIAAALGIPYPELSHDLQRASYASSRAGLVAYRMEVEAFQYAVLVFQFLRRVWQRWMDTAVLAGALPISATEYRRGLADYHRAKMITPKLPWVDPAKDARAEVDMVNNGFKSRSDVIESLGSDPEETDKRIAEDRQREAQLGLSFPVVISRGTAVADSPSGDSTSDTTTSSEAAA